MQCPSCDHTAPQADFGDPMRCPGCGAYYEKALKLKLAAANSSNVAATPTPQVQKQAFRLAADHVEVATRGLDGVQPVVVVDIQMRFWSMMVFMLKWMLAAIPATIAFLVIMAMLIGLFGGLTGGFLGIGT